MVFISIYPNRLYMPGQDMIVPQQYLEICFRRFDAPRKDAPEQNKEHSDRFSHSIRADCSTRGKYNTRYVSTRREYLIPVKAFLSCCAFYGGPFAPCGPPPAPATGPNASGTCGAACSTPSDACCLFRRGGLTLTLTPLSRAASNAYLVDENPTCSVPAL